MAVPLTEIQLERVANKLLEVGRYFANICRSGLPECSEDHFRAKFEHALYEEALRKLGVPEPVHEYKVSVPDGALLVRHYRIDSYYGLVFFEYKLPRKEIGEEALVQVKDKYIPGLLNDHNTKALLQKIREKGYKPVIVGIITNGLEVVSVEYDVDNNIILDIRRLQLDKEAVRYVIRYIIASWKRRLDAHALSAEFGHGSDLAKKAVRLFYEKLLNAKGRPRDMYEEWKRQVSIVYPGGGAEVAEVARDYGIEGEVDGSKLFYAIQTYYALILKLLAAEVASRYYDSVVMSFLKELKETATDEKKLRERLGRLEEGGPMAWYGVLNLFEGQLFSWYLDVWDGEVFAVVREVVDKLVEFDVESLRPETARDLFKVLYEELVPRKEVRRKLGIYTTPDWLAELILDELGLTVEKMLEVGKDDPLAPLRVKILDPGVGTGTFLVLYLQRVGEYLRRRFDQVPADVAAEALRLVTQNVVGFDVDVLALLTARTNYLIALAATGLLQHKRGRPIEIPIYMANSIAPAEGLRRKILVGEGAVEVITVPTAVSDFDLPLSAMSRIKEVLEIITDSLRKNEPTERVLRRIDAKGADAEVFKTFYEKLKKLKDEGRDSVWVDVVKSYLIPNAYFNQFDYVVGNPPWITLNKLSASYQELVKPLVKDEYKLTTKSELITQIEMATLFLVRALDLYLKDGGKLGFVMPRSIFSADQHHNFRRGEVAVKYAVEKVVDAEGVSPLFYVPACAVVVRKGGEVQYPITAVVLRGKLPEDKHKIIALGEALKYLTREDKQIHLSEIGGRSAWTYEELQVAKGRSYYYDYFRQGATVVPRPFFFVEIEGVGDDFVVVKPSRRTERREAKVKFDIMQMPVEVRFLYGVLTSSEIVPFCHLPPAVVALPIEPRGFSYVLYTAKELRTRDYPHMANRMEKIEKLWEEYRGEKKEVSIYEWLNYQNKLTAHNPAAKFRVVYSRSGTHLVAAVVEAGKKIIFTPKGQIEISDTIIDYTLYHYQTGMEDEAHYLAAVLNSSVLDQLVKPLQSRGEFGERDFVKKPLEFPIPKYSASGIHKELADLGRKAREASCGSLERILKELDLYGKLKERGYLTPQEVARLREAIRRELAPIIQEIDDRVKRLLRVGNSNSLLDYI